MEFNNLQSLLIDGITLDSFTNILEIPSQVPNLTPAIPYCQVASPVPSLTALDPILSPMHSMASSTMPSPVPNRSCNLTPLRSSMPTQSSPAMTSLSIDDDDESMQIALSSLQKLIRDEVREKILSQRRNKGQEEIHPDFGERSRDVPCELSLHDIVRRDSRKDQNRRASKKYRLKQRGMTSQLNEEFCREESLKVILQQEVNDLNEQVQMLTCLLHTHLPQCVNVTPTSSSQQGVAVIRDEHTSIICWDHNSVIGGDHNNAIAGDHNSVICDDHTDTFPQLIPIYSDIS